VFKLKPATKKDFGVFILLFFLASANFLLFGLNEYTIPSGDSEQYNLYAKNIALGNGYTADSEGNGFSLYREPGYSLFVSSIYSLFGVENFLAVKIAQVVLLALISFLIFKLFQIKGYKKLAVAVGSLVAFFPLYAYQANLIQSELWTAFLLACSLLLVISILKDDKNKKYYILLGVVFSILGLTRAHLLLLPFVFGAVSYYKNKPLKYLVIPPAMVVVVALSWATYVYLNTGFFAITKGRDNLHLYTRSERSALSYDEQVKYYKSWFKRSALGGREDEILEKYEPGPLIKQYAELIQKGRTEEELKKESIAKIKSNLDRYILGNPLEIIKMMFIEHLFPPVSSLLTRTLRAVIYFATYLIFSGGALLYMFSKKKRPSLLVNVGLIYIIYHWVVLSFFDVIPRFNTPYLWLYLVVGVAGLTTKFKIKS